MARIKKMSTVTKRGSRAEQLKNLANVLANQIDECTNSQAPDAYKMIPQLSKQYRETIRELEEIEGVKDDEDEISELISSRKADGKPTTIR